MEHHWFNMIKQLRKHEQVILYVRVLEITDEEREKVADFLEEEYHLECENYPFNPPHYDKEAAMWAAEIVGQLAQFILYREPVPEAFYDRFNTFQKKITPSIILSADLTFRFWPFLLKELEHIDPDDELITWMRSVMSNWGFSMVKAGFTCQKDLIKIILSDACVRHLYLNRIIEYKALDIALEPEIREVLSSNLGMYMQTFWPDFHQKIQDDND